MLKSVSEMCCASMIVPLLLPRSEQGWEGRAGQSRHRMCAKPTGRHPVGAREMDQEQGDGSHPV